jgi:hypothetical protein
MTLGRKRESWWKAVARVVVPKSVRTAIRRRQSSAARERRLTALTPDLVETIRANPQAARDGFAACRDDLTAVLGPAFADLTDAELRLSYCAALAHAAAPYGESTAIQLADMLAAPRLNCGNYPFLMIRLAEIVCDGPAPVVSLVGWDGGAIGNHAMGYRADPAGKRCLFLDPTVGLIARGTFDEVASGRPLPADRVVCFGDRIAERPYREMVARAFVRGEFRPSDLLYYFEDIDHQFGRYGDPWAWPTPGGIAWRARHPRPGAA